MRENFLGLACFTTNAELDCVPVYKLNFEPTQWGIESKMPPFIFEVLVFNNVLKIVCAEAALPNRRANVVQPPKVQRGHSERFSS